MLICNWWPFELFCTVINKIHTASILSIILWTSKSCRQSHYEIAFWYKLEHSPKLTQVGQLTSMVQCTHNNCSLQVTQNTIIAGKIALPKMHTKILFKTKFQLQWGPLMEQMEQVAPQIEKCQLKAKSTTSLIYRIPTRQPSKTVFYQIVKIGCTFSLVNRCV